MASPPQKEALVVVLDIGSRGLVNGPAMQAVSLLLQQKMMFSARDEVSLVLLGTEATHNKLASSGSYQHVTVVRPFMCPDVKILESLGSLKEENYPGDLLDALVVAADLIHEKTEGKRFRKKIFLVTSAARKERRKDDLQAIMDAVKGKEISVVVVGIDFTENKESENDDNWDKLTEKQTNERVLHYMCEYIGNNSVVIMAAEALDTLSQLRGKTIQQRPYASIVFDIGGGGVKIPIRMYAKSIPQTLPPMKTRSTKVPGELREVILERTYHTVTGHSKEIPKKEAVRAFRYGRSVIPLNELDEDKLKNRTTGPKSMALLAFVAEADVPRHYLIGNTFMVAHIPNDDPGRKTFTALVHGMSHLGRAAMVRFTWRNGVNPKVGILFPVVKPSYSVMYYADLPYTEDIRSYPFRTLGDVEVSPSEQASMDEYVRGASKDDGVDLRSVHNPVLHHYYQCLRTRAMDPSCAIPAPNPNIHARCCHWGEEGNVLYDVGVTCSFASAKLKESFQISELKAKGADDDKRKKFWFAQGGGGDDSVPSAKRLKVDPAMGTASHTTQSTGGPTVPSAEAYLLPTPCADKVGTMRPVDDFEAMVSRRDKDVLIPAVREMQEVVFTLLKHAVGSDLHARCYSCITALRRVCVRESLWDEFNSFMRHLKGFAGGETFWKEHVVASRVTPIHDGEVTGAAMTAKEAEAFALTQFGSADIAVFEDIPSDDEDQLFDQLE